MMLQPYEGYLIEGTALLVQPFSSEWYVGGCVLATIWCHGFGYCVFETPLARTMTAQQY